MNELMEFTQEFLHNQPNKVIGVGIAKIVL